MLCSRLQKHGVRSRGVLNLHCIVIAGYYLATQSSRRAAALIAPTAFPTFLFSRQLPVADDKQGSLAADWSSWWQIWDVYTFLMELNKKSAEYQAIMQITYVRADALSIRNALPYADE